MSLPFQQVPDQFKIYNSYDVDPKWQIKFTIIWTSVLALSTLVSLPYIYRSYRNGRLYSGLLIQEDSTRSPKKKNITHPPKKARKEQGVLERVYRRGEAVVQSAALWTLPVPNVRFWKSQVGDCCRRAYFSLSIAQIGLVLAYMGATVACFVVAVPLTQNSNRPGFIALAQLPLVILLSLKSPLPLPIFLPRLSYEHYNFLHRWVGRTLFITATVHGGMWLNQFIKTDQWDQVWAEKSKRGMLAYGLMGGVVITSLKPIRRLCYQLFWIAHLSLFIGFFAAISYHTPYSRPWIYPCVAIYAYDLLVRMFRFRFKDATLVPVDDTLTMIHIANCDAGWLPTQHVLLRVLMGSGVFESHPFTITNAPSSSFSASPRGIILYAKVSGDWTRKLHAMASDVSTLETGDDIAEREGFLQMEKEGKAKGWDHPGKKVMVMIDGPYGGLKIDLGDYDSVLLVAGGSGITFVLGAIEEALRVRESGRGPSQIEVAWVVRDTSTIDALAPTLHHLHSLATRLSTSLTYNLYLSNPPSPLPAVPSLLPPSTTLSPYRPEVAQLVREALPPPTINPQELTGSSGGLAVVACGPEGIVMEARNAVAGLSVSDRVRSGGVGFHGETYAL
ncbi:putative ferric reductase transmembrane component [Naematelia encephala]|uniref:Putative ferric reductase transmembrane component n=1 Tax=Naematelia encephala TaxID=71784 RepID=A0A1Y2BCG2_9TREE|nr:putative ferric reductase transmembrane component [Naematelia encephala]